MRARRCVVLGAAALPLLALAAPAAAGTTTSELLVDRSAWSWRKALPGPIPTVEPSGVPAGGLAVAHDGRPDAPPAKAAYLRLDLGDLPQGGRVSDLAVALPLHPGGDSSDSTGVRLVACRLLADFEPGEGVDPAAMPEEDCTDAPAGAYDEAGQQWTFALTDLATAWAADPSSNHGFVVRPAPDHALPADLPFQLDLAGPEAVRAQLTVVVAAQAPVGGGGTVEVVEEPPPAVEPTTTELGGWAGGVSTPAPPMDVTGPVPVTAPAATAAPTPVVGVRALPVLPASEPATGTLWALLAALAVLLAGVARVASDTAGPVALARLERQWLDRVRLHAPVSTTAAPAATVEPLVVPAPSAEDGAQGEHSRQGRSPRSAAASIST